MDKKLEEREENITEFNEKCYGLQSRTIPLKCIQLKALAEGRQHK